MALLLPVGFSGAGLGWYNWARFGSIFEFGYRYQLTLLVLPKHYGEIFSLAYFIPNLYNYFLNPFVAGATFPFIKPQAGQTYLGTGITFPKIYYSEDVTGLVYTLPIMILAVIPPLLLLVKKGPNKGTGATWLNWYQCSLIADRWGRACNFIGLLLRHHAIPGRCRTGSDAAQCAGILAGLRIPLQASVRTHRVFGLVDLPGFCVDLQRQPVGYLELPEPILVDQSFSYGTA